MQQQLQKNIVNSKMEKPLLNITYLLIIVYNVQESESWWDMKSWRLFMSHVYLKKPKKTR